MGKKKKAFYSFKERSKLSQNHLHNSATSSEDDILEFRMTQENKNLTMTACPQVALQRAEPSMFGQLVNLTQFYNYDCSEWLPITFSKSGLFELRPKLAYLSASSTSPYFILVEDEVAGFAIVDNEVNVADVSSNMGYFFVARRFKRRGIGVQALTQLFALHPGRWQVWHPAANEGARNFWTKVIPRLASSTLETHTLKIDGEEAELYAFDAS